MHKRLLLLLLVFSAALFFSQEALAKNKFVGFARDAGAISVGGTNSATKAIRTYPGAVIAVYAYATSNLLTIYSDDAGAAKANPFTAAADGSFSFFADEPYVDVRVSGGGVGSPFTFTLGTEQPFSANDRRIGGHYNVTSTAIDAAGDGTADDRPELNTLVNTTLATTGGEVYFPGPTSGATRDYLVASNMTFPANVTLTFAPGAQLEIPTGVTVTVLGDITPTHRKIFNWSGSGVVTFTGNTRLRTFLSEWWGAKADSTTDSTSSLRVAVAAVEAVHGKLELLAGGYLVTSSGTTPAITFTKSLEVAGQGMMISRILVDSTMSNTAPVLKIFPAASGDDRNMRGYHFHDFGVEAEGGHAEDVVYYGEHALLIETDEAPLSWVSESTFERLFLGPLGPNGRGFVHLRAADSGNAFFTSTVRDCFIYNGVYLLNVGDTLGFYDNSIRGENEFFYQAVVGATGLLLHHNNITLKKGISIRKGIGIVITGGNIIELYRTGSVGTNGATVSFDAISPGDITVVLIEGNSIGSLGLGDALHGIFLNGVRTAVIGMNNFSLQNATKTPVHIPNVNTENVSIDNSHWTYSNVAPTNTYVSADPSLKAPTYAFQAGYPGIYQEGYNKVKNAQHKFHIVEQLIGTHTGNAAAGTVAAGAGTSATCTVTGNALRGSITLVTGSGSISASANHCTVTLINAGTVANAPVVVSLHPANAAAAALSGAESYYAPSAQYTTAGFQLWVGSSAPATAQTFIFTYDIIQ